METSGIQIALDIETVANERATEWWDKKKIEAPKNYKDPEKIEAYVHEKRLSLYSDSALHWWTGKVFSFAVVDVKNPTEKYFEYSLDESEVLNRLSQLVDHREVFAKSGKDFDYPFLVGRYMANNLPVPSFLRNNFQMAREVNHFFSRYSTSGQTASLEAYAHGLGIGGKDGDFKCVGRLYDALITGESTPEMVTELMNYNLRDADIVAEMVRRYNGN